MRDVEKERDKAKFPPKGRLLHYLPEDGIETTIDGKFGKQRMVILQTLEIGAVYVTIPKFLDIAREFAMKDFEGTVEA